MIHIDTYESNVAIHAMTTAEYEERALSMGGTAPVKPACLVSRVRDAVCGWESVDTGTEEDCAPEPIDISNFQAMMDCLEPFDVWGDIDGDTLTLYSATCKEGCEFTHEECERPLRAMYSACGLLGYRAQWGAVMNDWQSLFS